MIEQNQTQTNSLLRQLLREESGSVGWIGLILMTSVVALGTTVGLSTYRDHVVQQFGDSAVALRGLRQDYQYRVEIDANRNGSFGDLEDCVLEGDFSDVVDLVDEPGNAPSCMNMTAAPENEG